MYNRHRMIDYDRNYPRQSKFHENIDRIGTEELLPVNLSGEVELIARASYRLGIAEGNLNAVHHEAMQQSERNDTLEKELSSANSDLRTYRNRAERYEADNEELNVKVEKLEKKLKPKKKVAKKKAKK